MEQEKRCRSANFTIDEKMLCLSLIKKYSDVIESKKTDSYTWRDKDAAWKNVEREFNSQNSGTLFRTKEVLKKFFENKKKEARKISAEINKTGRGPTGMKAIDPIYNLTKSIIDKTSVFGLFDGVKAHLDYYGNGLDGSIVTGDCKSEDPKKVSEEIEVNEGLMHCQNSKTSYNSAVHSESSKNKNCDSYLSTKPATLQNVTKNISQQKEQGTLSQHIGQNEYEESICASKRRPRLSPNTSLVKKCKDLSDAKMEIALMQKEILKAEKEKIYLQIKRDEEEYKLKRERDEEIFLLQKQSALLDIQIKKRQLEKLNFDI